VFLGDVFYLHSHLLKIIAKMLNQDVVGGLIALPIIETLKRLLSTLRKDIKKARRHGSRPHQSGIFEYLHKTTFNS
jgi:hypothetical protein